MTNERQTSANRRNARKSTGPRSSAGKNWASRNAYRHGLTSTMSGAYAKEREKLARKIVGDSEDPVLLERARAVAEAELELARVRRAKVATIARMFAFEGLDAGSGAGTKPLDPSATRAMPATEPHRSAEALRRAIPELVKLDRYERRASARRDRAVRGIADGSKK